MSHDKHFRMASQPTISTASYVCACFLTGLLRFVHELAVWHLLAVRDNLVVIQCVYSVYASTILTPWVVTHHWWTSFHSAPASSDA
jgi:hypothetical protein